MRISNESSCTLKTSATCADLVLELELVKTDSRSLYTRNTFTRSMLRSFAARGGDSSREKRVLDVGNINGGDYKHGTADARTANPSCASDFTGAPHTKHCTTRKETQTQTRRRRDEHPFAITIVKRHPIKQLLILVIIIL